MEMVVLHEIGHIQRYHAWLRILPILAGAVCLTIITVMTTGLFLMIGVVSVLITQSWLLHRVAHWSEMDADRWAAMEFAKRLLANLAIHPPTSFRIQTEAEANQYAAKAMASAIKELVPPRYHAKSTWMHPSVLDRERSLLNRLSTPRI